LEAGADEVRGLASDDGRFLACFVFPTRSVSSLVEAVDDEGMTPWLASFASDELELVQRY